MIEHGAIVAAGLRPRAQVPKPTLPSAGRACEILPKNRLLTLLICHVLHHPRAGERVAVVVAACSMAAASISSSTNPDGTRGLLPAWMTEPRAGQLATTEVPRLALEALLRGVITGALLSLSTSTTMREGVKCMNEASPMPDKPDLLTRVVKALRPDRIPPATRTEVTRLLKRLMTECVVAGWCYGRSRAPLMNRITSEHLARGSLASMFGAIDGGSAGQQSAESRSRRRTP